MMVGDAREREDVGVREWDRAKAAELYNAIATGATHEDVAEALAIYRQAHIGIALSRDYTARRATCAEVEAELRQERDAARAECERLRDERDDLADAVDALRRIGQVIGCDHTDGAGDRARLVRCVRESFDAAQAEAAEARAECERLRSECDLWRSYWRGNFYRYLVKVVGKTVAEAAKATDDREREITASFAPPPAAVGRNVYACGCSGSDGRCPVHGDYPIDTKEPADAD